jgi:hypothetical protein
MDFDARVIAYVAAFRIIIGHVREVSALSWLGKGTRRLADGSRGGAALSSAGPLSEERFPHQRRKRFQTQLGRGMANSPKCIKA